MSIDLDILLQRNLVTMVWSGIVNDDQSAEALQTYATHPDARIGQDILSDMSRVEIGYFDLPKRLALQASLDRVLGLGDKNRTIVYFAPTPQSQELANQYAALWDATPSVTAHVTDSETEALALLKITAKSIAEVLSESA